LGLLYFHLSLFERSRKHNHLVEASNVLKDVVSICPSHLHMDGISAENHGDKFFS